MDAKQFNLLSYVQKKSWFGAKLSLLIVVIYLLVLILLTIVLTQSKREINQEVVSVKQNTTQLAQQFQQYIGKDRQLVAVSPSPVELDSEGFYKEFQALSTLDIPNLWLTQIIIDRGQRFIKITGDMASTDKLNQLLKFLGANKVFKEYYFQGIEVSEDFLPPIPKSMRKQADELEVPKIYHFVVQTTEIKKNSGRG